MFCRWCFQSLFTPPFPRHVRAGIAFDGIYFAAAVQREFVRCGRLLCLPALRLGLRSSLSRICRSCSRRGAAEGDFEASLPAFAAVAQNAGRHQNCPERAAGRLLCLPALRLGLRSSLPAFAVVAQDAGGGVGDVAALPGGVGHPEAFDHLCLSRIKRFEQLTI